MERGAPGGAKGTGDTAGVKGAVGLRVRSVSWRLRRPVSAGEEVLAAGDPPRDGRAVLRIAAGREDRHATAEVVAA